MPGKTRDIVNVSAWRARLQIIIPSALVCIFVILSAVYADLQQQQLSVHESRHAVQQRLGLIRTKIEANINANTKLLQGLVAVISTEPQMEPERFEALSESIFQFNSQIRNVVAAPNLVTSFAYPPERNSPFRGRQILQVRDRDALLRDMVEEGKVVITGPTHLNNGTQGLVVNIPVRIWNDNGQMHFWGALLGILDLPRLYDDSGLLANELPIEVLITAENRLTSEYSVVYGDANIRDLDPVRMNIDLVNQKWTISAIPRGGWDGASGRAHLSRIAIFAVAALICGIVVWVAMLMNERQRNFQALHEREEALRAMSHRLGIALESSRIGVWELNVTTGVMHWDERICQLYGLPTDTPVTMEQWRGMVPEDDVAEIERQMREAIDRKTSYTGQFRVRRADTGEVRNMRTVGTIYRGSDGAVTMLGVNWDVTDDVILQDNLRAAHKQTEDQNAALEAARQSMEHNALHDALTGLPNRRYLDQRLAALDRVDLPGQQLTVLHMDLDRFKEINDTMGHGAGDAILRNVAEALRANVRDDDFVARIGGDEFVIVCFGYPGHHDFGSLGQRLIAAVNTPVLYNGHECRVGASIGIASKTEPQLAAEQVLVNADIALYEAKRRGRNRVEYFNDHLRARTINIKKTADAILRSLGDNDFVAFYQPQFDARTLEINGVEALARWNHPQQGLLPPSAFLEIAESLNVVAQIDASILDQALLQLSRWRAADLGIEHVSVNISAQRLFEDRLVGHLETLSLKPGSLSFELLESISFDDKADAVAESLERIRAHGIAIEIDDFGTGYASILSLIKLSPSRLKIDRQLVAPIVDNPAQRRLISSIIDIGRSFGIGIVAEGVETMEHAAILRDLGCHTLQGYALARPMGAEALMEFARRHALERETLWQKIA
jgi:diguanylate cyclase (GGDEF)-like protein/PAS domain S-box-containing protein